MLPFVAVDDDDIVLKPKNELVLDFKSVTHIVFHTTSSSTYFRYSTQPMRMLEL